MTDRGLFVTIEGTEGAGKTTLIRGLREEFEARDWQVLTLYEPGGTALGERLGGLIKQSALPRLPDVEMLLFFAARMQLVAEQIEPALERGCLVLCDRYLDSTWAYQVCAGKADPELFESLVQRLKVPLPDLTLLLELSSGEGLRRIRPEGESGQLGFFQPQDTFEEQGEAFLQLVCEGFRQRAQQQADRIRVIDASQPLPDVRRQALAEFESWLASRP